MIRLTHKLENLSNKKVVFENKDLLHERINKINHIVKKIENISGKKVLFKEDIDKTKTQILKQIYSKLKEACSNITTANKSLSSSLPLLSKVDPDKDEYEEIKRIVSELSHHTIKTIKTVMDKVDGSNKNMTIEEDVEMTSDDILQKPNVVKKLDQNNIDIDVNDNLKNKQNKNTNTSSTNYVSPTI